MKATETLATDYARRVDAIATLIRDNVEWSQRERRLAPAVVDAFHDAGLFSITIPRELGGDGANDWEVMPPIEAVARIDASAAWNLAIGNGSLTLVRAVDEAGATEILSEPRILAAGVISPGIAFTEVDGGFRVNGRGAFASGCSQANWIVAGGALLRGGAPILRPIGGPQLKIGCIPMDQVEILDTWNTTGLRGTGSHDVIVRDVFVPATRTGDPVAPNSSRYDRLGAIPVQSRLGSQVTMVAIGATWHAIEELRALAAHKPNFGSANLVRERSDVQNAVARATGLVDAARATVMSGTIDVLQRTLDGEAVDMERLAKLRLAGVMATSLCLEAVDLVHAAAGTSTLGSDSVIGLCWRDVHAVSQHVSQQAKHFENVGRVMLGLPPQGML